MLPYMAKARSFSYNPVSMSTDETSVSVLVIRMGALGDVANAIRAVAGLRAALPSVHVTWVAETAAGGLVEAAQVADDVIPFPRKELSRLFKRPWLWPKGVSALLRFRRRLHERKYDCALDLQGNFKGALAGMLSGATDRLGFARGHCREMNWLFNNVLIMPAGRRIPRAEKFAALAQAVAPEMQLGRVTLPRNETYAAQVGEFLGSDAVGPLVVVHPGTSAFAAFKRWPVERYGAVCARLRESTGARCVVTQGPGERDIAEAVVNASRGAASPAPELPIRGLIELLRRADLVIAGDTGPLHIAALLERPLVAVFTSKDPAIYAPYGAQCEIVRADVACSPCTKRKCADLRCVLEIPPEAVAEAAERMLAADRER